MDLSLHAQTQPARKRAAPSRAFDVCGISHRGLIRVNNEDFWFADEKLGLAIVADGVGGQADGALASRAAVGCVAKYLRRAASAFSRATSLTASSTLAPTRDSVSKVQERAVARAIDLANLRRDVGASAAIVVPIHLPFGQIAAAGFSRYDCENADLANEYALFADELALYARVFVSGYVKATCSSYWLPRETRLSRHEVECLRWAAIGKTDDEISRIIGRSRSTVRFHVNSASSKLGAANRSQTVFKAAQLGFLGMWSEKSTYHPSSGRA